MDNVVQQTPHETQSSPIQLTLEWYQRFQAISSATLRSYNGPHGTMTPVTEPISTRPALSTDLEFLANVYKGTRQDEMDGWGWPAAQQESFARMQFQARRMWYSSMYPDALECLIVRGDMPVGSVITRSSATELRVVDIAILPEHRNLGIGGHLISSLVKNAVASNQRFTLSVLRSNPAIRLYERLGLQPRPGRDDAYLEMEYE